MDSSRIAALLQWCRSQGIRIDPRVMVHGDGESGISVYAADACIENLTTIVSIPKPCILSAKTCSLSAHFARNDDGGAADSTHCRLALALHFELLKGTQSRWFGYLQSLPQRRVDLALFWDSDGDDDDRREAMAWLKGTQVEKELLGVSGWVKLEDIRRYYVNVVQPLISQLSVASTLEGFYHAYSLVSSRAFHVDAYHGLAMVPIADAFNHSQDNQVHLETDYDVCATCGSLFECPHDRDLDLVDSGLAAAAGKQQLPDFLPHYNSTEEFEDTCEMVCNCPIQPHEEVFNTYGNTLTNAQLLVQYGFVLDSNDNDIVSWDSEELLSFCERFQCQRVHPGEPGGQSVPFWELFMEILSTVEYAWADSRLVYEPQNDLVAVHAGTHHCSMTAPISVMASRMQGSTRFWLNAEAKVSHHLWLFCALLHLQSGVRFGAHRVTMSGDLSSRIAKLLRDQLFLEDVCARFAYGADDDGAEELESDKDKDDDQEAHAANPPEFAMGSSASVASPGGDLSGTQASPDTTQLLDTVFAEDVRARKVTESCAAIAEIGRTIVSLCDIRVSGMRHASLSGQEIGEQMDSIPRHMMKSRLTASQALGERSLLESCALSWKDLARGCEVLSKI